jgi:hypothetical protein
MATAKTAALGFRIEPKRKEALRTAAERVHRSIAKRVAVLIIDYCDVHGIEITGQDAQTTKTKTATRKTRQ